MPITIMKQSKLTPNPYFIPPPTVLPENDFFQTEDFGTLCICALRYCHGRKTYMPSLVISIVTPFLQKFSDKDIGVMQNDCKYQEQFNLYGDESIDKPVWLQWKSAVEEEISRRNALK